MLSNLSKLKLFLGKEFRYWFFDKYKFIWYIIDFFVWKEVIENDEKIDKFIF